MFFWSAIFGFFAVSAVAVRQPPSYPKHTPVPNAYLLQLNNRTSSPPSRRPKRSLSAHESFHKRAANIDYSVRTEFRDPNLFFGLSIKLNENVTESLAKEMLGSIPDVVSIWPVYLVRGPTSTPSSRNTNLPSSMPSLTGPGPNISNSSIPRVTGDLKLASTHLMSEIDKVHSLGIKGKGIKIGIIDSGVDYRHPSLGGGFGPGYKIAGGFCYVTDSFDGFEDTIEAPDPLATCYGGGHGTHVSGTSAQWPKSKDILLTS
jgi:Subtilase family